MTVDHRLLGPVEPWVDEHPVDLGYAQQRFVFAVLLVHLNQVVSPAQLIDRVWGGNQPRSARPALYAHIARLRRVLVLVPGTRLAKRPGGYLLEADPDTVDLHRFRRLVAAARTADGGHTEDGGRADDLFDQALGLWRGVPFTDLVSPWMDTMRDSIEAERVGAILDRNEVYLRAGRHRELTSGLAELCAAHPLDEGLADQLMRALYRSGRQAAALSCYHQLRRRLTDELGVDPQPGLKELFEQILRNDPALTLAEPHRAPPGQKPAELPHNVWGFTGRETELTRLLTLVNPGGAANHHAVPIAVIDGAAGTGKTALAVHFAHQVAHEFPDGQLFIDLGGFGPREPPLLPSAALERLLEGLGAEPEHIPRRLGEQAARYRSMLADRRVLIVLDNAESAEQVRPLLPGGGRCLVLVTSRTALTALVATDGAVRIALDVLSAGESAGLLARTIGASRTASEPAAAAQLAGLCGHLPLALRIASARAATHPHHTLADLAAELAVEHRRLDLLTADEVTSVRAAFCWSYRTLPAAAARVFRLLGLHPGTDIEAGAAAALTADPDTGPLLDKLMAACLLQPSGRSRYRIHDLVKLYAYERAHGEEGEAGCAAATSRLVTWYLHTADAADRVLIPGRRRVPLTGTPAAAVPAFGTYHEALAWCDAERPNLVAVTRQAAKIGAHETAWELPVALWGYFMVRKPWSQWETTHQIGLAAARQLRDSSGEAHILGSLAFVHLDQRRYPEAIQNMCTALAWCQSSGDQWGAAIALLGLGMAYRQLGDHTAATRSWHRAMAIWRRIGDDWGAAHTLNNLGDIYRDKRRPDKAIACLRQALEILTRAGDTWGQARTLTNLGSSLGDLHRHQEAIGCLTQALRIRREITDQRGQAETLDRLAAVLVQTGAPAKARTAWRAALTIFQQLGDPQAEIVQARLAATATASPHATGSRRDEAETPGLLAAIQNHSDRGRLAPATAAVKISAQPGGSGGPPPGQADPERLRGCAPEAGSRWLRRGRIRRRIRRHVANSGLPRR